jgi:hypothetical protein
VLCCYLLIRGVCPVPQPFTSFLLLHRLLPLIHLLFSLFLPGKFTASEITFEHPTLRRLVPYVELGVDDHFLAAYRRSLRAVLPTRRTRYNPSNVVEVEEREEEVEKEVEKEVERRPVQWQVLPFKFPRITSHHDLVLLPS